MLWKKKNKLKNYLKKINNNKQTESKVNLKRVEFLSKRFSTAQSISIQL